MEYQTKTQTRVDISFEVAGPLVPVAQPTPPLEDVAVELTDKEVIQLAEYALQDTADIAEEVEAFQRKRFAVFSGIRGQVKVAAASLMATAVVITGLGFVSRATQPHPLDRGEWVEYQAPFHWETTIYRMDKAVDHYRSGLPINWGQVEKDLEALGVHSLEGMETARSYMHDLDMIK